MKGDDACSRASQLDLLIDSRRMIYFLRCIRLLSPRPSPGDGAPLLGGVGKLASVLFSVLTLFLIYALLLPRFDLTGVMPLGYLPASDTWVYMMEIKQ